MRQESSLLVSLHHLILFARILIHVFNTIGKIKKHTVSKIKILYYGCLQTIILVRCIASGIKREYTLNTAFFYKTGWQKYSKNNGAFL